VYINKQQVIEARAQRSVPTAHLLRSPTRNIAESNLHIKVSPLIHE